jgi:hypothetical protein
VSRLIDAMTRADRDIARIASRQSGAFTRSQGNTVGLTDRQLRGRVQRGDLDKIGTRTFRSPSVPQSLLSELIALMLDIGECWASGPTAAALHGFDGFKLARPFHITVLRGRNIARVGVTVHTTAVLPLIDRCTVCGIAATSAARTVIDLARHVATERLTIALDSGLRDGGFNEDLLHRRIIALRNKGRYGIPKLLDVIAGVEVIRGGHSWLEREYLRITAAAGLPRPVMQRVLSRARDRLVRVDCHYPGTNVVVELLGYRFHSSSAALRRDAERLNALVLQGCAPFQFTYEQIAGAETDQTFVLDTVKAALGL